MDRGAAAAPEAQRDESPEHDSTGAIRKSVPEPENQGWVAVEPDSVGPDRIPAYRETVKDSVLVALSDELWSWKAGDQVSLSVPQIDASFITTIERVAVGLGNNRSYFGKLGDEERRYSFVITVGDRNAFAFLATPAGSYELVGNTELAWLMPSANLDQHVDYSKPDFYIVEEPEYFTKHRN